VFAYAGHPSWAFMIINRAPSSGTFRVQLVTTHLRTIDAGNCDIVARQGIWGWRLHLPVDEIARIQLMHAGVPIMSAAFA
jgi:hypothetical protein